MAKVFQSLFLKTSIGNISVPFYEAPGNGSFNIDFQSGDYFEGSIPITDGGNVGSSFTIKGDSGTEYVFTLSGNGYVGKPSDYQGSLVIGFGYCFPNVSIRAPLIIKFRNGEYALYGTSIYTTQTSFQSVDLTVPSSGNFGYAVATYTDSRREPYGTSPEAVIKDWVKDIVDAGSWNFPVPDPYSAGGESEEDLGGDGSFDDSSDQIEDSTLPTISAANTGFTRIYNPSLAQVQALASYLWTDQTILQTLWNHVKQFLENPMDAFIAFNLVPCAVPDGGTTEFKVMYIGTGVNMTAAASQFVDVDCGTLDIDEYYGSALDYAPNTKISVFLPFIGTVQLDTDDVMGKTIGIKYRIDIVSGGCVAKIIVDGSIHYQYSGHCAVNIPFTSADYTGYISAMLQAAKVGSTIASAGASAAAATAEEGVAIPEMAAAGATAAEMMEASRAYDRRIIGSAVEGTAQATFNSLAPKNISNTVGVVMSSKPVVERSGSFSGNTGYLGIRRPFCIIERPRMCNPSDYGKYNGRPAMLTMSLGDCSGFTKVQQVQLTGIPATNPELDEIGAFLKGGVIL